MKGLLIVLALVSCIFAGDIDPKLLETKKELSAKHDNMEKLSAEQYAKHVSSFEKFTKEELDLEEATALPSGPVINEDIKMQKNSKGEQQ